MKKIILFAGFISFAAGVLAQDNPTPAKKEKIDLSNRANDHFMIQLGYAGWSGKPDSINRGGISKSFNFYFMLDFPFKTNPHISVAFGPGLATDNPRFKETYIGIKENTSILRFVNQSDTNHFKKTKLAIAYLEAPIEFRFTKNPLDNSKSFKWALGVKVGTMINAHTRNKELQDKNDNTIQDYTLKESSKKFFNSNRLSFMARVGFGHLSVYGSYQVTSLFKDGVAAPVKPFSVGLTLSGL
ncbi:MAG TPA: hypothetical protein VLJ68_05545 [Chitinophagaceae bacterium]|nr:hypothetical protein [Chitinophagaceae bacterium]